MRPLRSLLYVPGNQPTLFPKAIRSGADALILDLEDAVPSSTKEVARRDVERFLVSPDRDPQITVFVRVNPVSTPTFLEDITVAAGSGAFGIVLPKVESPLDVAVAARALEWVEASTERRGPEVVITPLLETAPAIRDAYAIGRASERVAYMGGVVARGGDVERTIGFRASKEAWETIPLRARILIDARAADIQCPISGIWTDVNDLDGLRAFALQNRNLGYEGISLIHPKHVPIANEIFGQSAEDLQHYERLQEAMRDAMEQGKAAVMFDGEMVDLAMLETARRQLSRQQPDRGDA